MRRLFTPRSLVLADVDSTFEIRAILDEDTLRSDIARKHGGLPQFNTLFTIDIAVDSPVNNDFLGIDVCSNPPIRTNSEVVFEQLDAAFYLSIDVKVFTAGKFAPYNYGLADVGYIGTTLIAGSIHIRHGTDLLTPSCRLAPALNIFWG